MVDAAGRSKSDGCSGEAGWPDTAGDGGATSSDPVCWGDSGSSGSETTPAGGEGGNCSDGAGNRSAAGALGHGDDGGGVVGGDGEDGSGDPVSDIGERRSLPSSSSSRSSSTSFRRFLFRLGGGVVSTGDSGVRLCASGMSSPAETARAATAGAVVATKPVGDGRSTLLPAVLAAVVAARTRPRRRGRRLLMVVAVMLTVGRLQETVAT